jgi:hypothetical protein
MRIVLLFILLLIWYYDSNLISPDQILFHSFEFYWLTYFLISGVSSYSFDYHLFQVPLTLARLYSHSQLIYLLILIISYENQYCCLFGYFFDIDYLMINLIRKRFLVDWIFKSFMSPISIELLKALI